MEIIDVKFSGPYLFDKQKIIQEIEAELSTIEQREGLCLYYAKVVLDKLREHGVNGLTKQGRVFFMGSNASASLSYGFNPIDDTELPWAEDDDSDIEDWWRKKNGYKPLFDPYANTKTGYVDNKTRDELREEIDAYHNHRNEWMDKNPLPVELVYRGSGYGESQVILAVPGSEINADWGEAKSVTALNEPDADSVKRLVDFVKKHKIKTVDKAPQWLLTAYYG